MNLNFYVQGGPAALWIDVLNKNTSDIIFPAKYLS